MDLDYYVKDSKIKEILDILRPPAKRNRVNSYQDYRDCIGYVIGDSDERNNKQKDKYANNHFLQKTVRSSLSLVLQKTCKKQILKRNPFYAENSKPKLRPNESKRHKPTIKVTVIPKTDPNCVLEYIDGKNQTIRNKVDTPYNNDNSIATKNVYLVISGKTRDKIYEIQATGDKKLREKSKNVRIASKSFPSKMEKNRNMSFEGHPFGYKCSDPNCFCRCPKGELSLEDEYPSGTSRVRIVGHIGRDKEDKYVMKCAATINGQPIYTNYVPAQTVPAATENVHETKPDTTSDKKTIHISLRNDNLNEAGSKSTISCASRQADASMQLTKILSTIDKNTQCNLCELCNTAENNNFDQESKPTNINRSTSPLVIISVYQKPDLYAIKTVDAKSMTRFEAQTYQSPLKTETGRANNYAINSELYNVRDLSPNRGNMLRCCPCETATKNATTATMDDTKSTNAKTVKTARASRSPSPAKKSNKKKTQERKKDAMVNTVNTTRAQSRSPSPKRSYTNEKNNRRDLNASRQNKKMSSINTKKTDAKKQRNETPRSKSKSPDKSIQSFKEQPVKKVKNTTDPNKSGTKRIMIKNHNNATRHETVLRKNLPKNEISKVSINIDSDREFYDVVFENGITTTDLIVKRTAKDGSSQKYFGEKFESHFEKHQERMSDSLENFFPIPGVNEHRRSASQDFNNENNDALPLSSTSRLNVRDSLEIGHRRDHTSKLNIHNDTDENIFFAPTKHYLGDDCDINPIERDKEIRKLLGIDNKARSKHHTAGSLVHQMYRNNTISRSCLYYNDYCNPLPQKLAHHRSYEHSACLEEKQNHIFLPKKDEDRSITDDEKRDLVKLNSCEKYRKRCENLKNRVRVAAVTKQQSTQCHAPKINLQAHREKQNRKRLEKQNVILLTDKQYTKVKKLLRKVNDDWKKSRHIYHTSLMSIGSVKTKRKNPYKVESTKTVQADIKDLVSVKSKSMTQKSNKPTVVLFFKEETDKSNERHDDKINEPRRKVSSIEMKYTSIAYSNVGDYSKERIPYGFDYKTNQLRVRRDSIETIFKGHKKSFTPNLGTSSLSLASEQLKSTAGSLPPDPKPRKPFLRRLMSCLVVRTETTDFSPVMKKRTQMLDSSVDSYNIDTSLGGMDMSSSIYDTSASFYSDHGIGVINNKIKRGFFNSVRELLSVRKN